MEISFLGKKDKRPDEVCPPPEEEVCPPPEESENPSINKDKITERNTNKIDAIEPDYMESAYDPNKPKSHKNPFDTPALSPSSPSMSDDALQMLLQSITQILSNIRSKSNELKEYIRINQGIQNRLILAPYDVIFQTSKLYAEQEKNVLDNDFHSIPFHFDQVDSMRTDEYILQYVRYLTEWNQLCLELAEEKKRFLEKLKTTQEIAQMLGKVNNNIFQSVDDALQPLITDFIQIETDLSDYLNDHISQS